MASKCLTRQGMRLCFPSYVRTLRDYLHIRSFAPRSVPAPWAAARDHLSRSDTSSTECLLRMIVDEQHTSMLRSAYHLKKKQNFIDDGLGMRVAALSGER